MDAVLLRIDDVSLLRRQELSRQRGTAGLEQLLEVLVQVDNGNQLLRTLNSYSELIVNF